MKKCSLLKRKENEVISYSQECKIYMCNKCQNYHLEYLGNHHIFKLEQNKNIEDIFTGFCKMKYHSVELNIIVKHIIYYVVLNALLN